VERGGRKKRATRPKSPLWQQNTNQNGWEALRESEAKFRDLYDNALRDIMNMTKKGELIKSIGRILKCWATQKKR
jgi:hypothetical protein